MITKRLYEELGPLLAEKAKAKPPSIVDHDSGPLDATSTSGDESTPMAAATAGDEHVTGSRHRGKKKSRRHASLIEDSTSSVLEAMQGKWDKDAEILEAQELREQVKEEKEEALLRRMEEREERMLSILESMSHSLHEMRR